MDMKASQEEAGPQGKNASAVMTRALDWDHLPADGQGVPYIAEYEGIKIRLGQVGRPFRLTMDAYWKYQAEKERKLYAIIDAYAQNNGHLNVTDAPAINASLFLNGISPLEYMAHRGLCPRRPPVPGVARASPA